MVKEIMDFATPQKNVIVCNGGKKALVLLNERTEERIVSNLTTDEEIDDKESYTAFVYDAYWIDISDSSEKGIVESSKRVMLEEIKKYDSSDSVNGIIINGHSVWIDKSTRMGLRQNIADKKALGQSNITLWMGDTPITMSCNKAEEWMCEIENYAFDCFNVTANHKANVQSMDGLEEVLTYDFTAGYPEKINISL